MNLISLSDNFILNVRAMRLVCSSFFSKTTKRFVFLNSLSLIHTTTVWCFYFGSIRHKQVRHLSKILSLIFQISRMFFHFLKVVYPYQPQLVLLFSVPKQDFVQSDFVFRKMIGCSSTNLAQSTFYFIF